MKKILIFSFLVFFSLCILFYYKPITLKYIFGIARIVKESNDYDLVINNKTYKNCIFKSNKSFDKKRNHNLLILYLRDLEIKSSFDIIIIDINEKFAGYTCGSDGCYDKVFGSLFQSDMGAFYTPLEDNAKGPGFDTKLKIENQKIDFYIPSEGKEKLHIQLTKNIN